MKKIVFLLISINLFAESIYASFDVIAEKSSKLALNSVGIVKSIKVNVGDRVKKGDVLLELDYSLENSGLDDAIAQKSLATKALNYANKILKRYEEVKSVLNQQILDDVNFKKSEAMQKNQSAQALMQKYKTLISQKILKAPFDGVISSKHIEIGEGVAGPMQTLFVINSAPKVKLLLSFDEKYEGKVKIGNEFEYVINGLKMKGKINKIYPDIDIKTRKIYAEVLANDITIGSFGEGYIKTDK